MKSAIVVGLIVLSFLSGFFIRSFEGGNVEVENKNSEYGYLRIPLLKGCNLNAINELKTDVESIELVKFDYEPHGSNITGYYLIKHKGLPSRPLTILNKAYSHCWPDMSVNYDNSSMLLLELSDPTSELNQAEQFFILKKDNIISAYFQKKK